MQLKGAWFWLSAPLLLFAGNASSESVAVDAESEFSLYVDDTDVTVITPAVDLSVGEPLDGWSLTGGYVLDIVSAASVDILTTASPAWVEHRNVGSVSGSYKPGAWQGQVSASVSHEPDYLSTTGGATLSVELDEKHVTPLLGYSYSHDVAGRSGTPYSVYSLELDRHTTQISSAVVLNRSTLLTLTADAIFELGSQEKPYRMLPLFADNVAAGLRPGESVGSVNRQRTGQVEESLPKTRQRYAVTGRLAWRGASSTWIFSERLYTDSWGILASTTELNNVYDVASNLFLGPHLRLHVQNGADFQQLGYVGSVIPGAATVPRYRTGDRELSPLRTATIGGEVRWDFASSWSTNLQADGGFTDYQNSLYLRSRASFLGALLLSKEF
jgi:hypothetical protein